MSVTFALKSCVTDEDFLNVSNANAREILSKMGVSTDGDDLYGSMLAKDFEWMARRTMMLVGFDPEIPGYQQGNMIFGGRPSCYLRNKLGELVKICQARITDEDEISWG